jgi:hypothetical protein
MIFLMGRYAILREIWALNVWPIHEQGAFRYLISYAVSILSSGQCLPQNVLVTFRSSIVSFMLVWVAHSQPARRQFFATLQWYCENQLLKFSDNKWSVPFA